jgi:hypothetical protein
MLAQCADACSYVHIVPNAVMSALASVQCDTNGMHRSERQVTAKMSIQPRLQVNRWCYYTQGFNYVSTGACVHAQPRPAP